MNREGGSDTFPSCREQKSSRDSESRKEQGITPRLRAGGMADGEADDLSAGSWRMSEWMLEGASGTAQRDTCTCLASPSSEGLGIVQQVDKMNWKKETLEAKREEAVTKIQQKESKLKQHRNEMQANGRSDLELSRALKTKARRGSDVQKLGVERQVCERPAPQQGTGVITLDGKTIQRKD